MYNFVQPGEIAERTLCSLQGTFSQEIGLRSYAEAWVATDATVWVEGKGRRRGEEVHVQHRERKRRGELHDASELI